MFAIKLFTNLSTITLCEAVIARDHAKTRSQLITLKAAAATLATGGRQSGRAKRKSNRSVVVVVAGWAYNETIDLICARQIGLLTGIPYIVVTCLAA